MSTPHTSTITKVKVTLGPHLRQVLHDNGHPPAEGRQQIFQTMGPGNKPGPLDDAPGTALSMNITRSSDLPTPLPSSAMSITAMFCKNFLSAGIFFMNGKNKDF